MKSKIEAVSLYLNSAPSGGIFQSSQKQFETEDSQSVIIEKSGSFKKTNIFPEARDCSLQKESKKTESGDPNSALHANIFVSNDSSEIFLIHNINNSISSLLFFYKV